MPELKQSERFALARKFAVDALALPADARKVGADTYGYFTPYGAVKVAITAVKDPDYDPQVEADAFTAERNVAKAKADALKTAHDAKVAAKAK